MGISLRHFLALSLFAPCVTFAQSTFQKAYGGPGSDGAGAVDLIGDSVLVCAGITQHPAFWNGDLWVYDADMYLVKSTLEGDIIWTQRIGSPNLTESASSFATTADGGFILCGYGSVVDNDVAMLLVKTDSLGQVAWAKSAGRPGYDAARQVKQTSDGGYIVVGVHTDTISNGAICILKFDANGDTAWTRILNSDSLAFDEAKAIQQNSDGDYVITGRLSNTASASLCFVKLSNDGNVLWARTFEGADDGQSICQTQDGGYAILGTHYDPISKNDLYLIRTDASGDTVWTATYMNPGWELARCVVESRDGGFVLSGATRASLAADDDACILRTDSLGNLIWSWFYGEGGEDWVNSVLELDDGGIIASGTKYGAGLGSYDLYMLRTDSSGSTGCNEWILPVVRSTPFVTISDIQFEITSGFIMTELSFTSTPFGSMSPICLTTAGRDFSDDHRLNLYPNPAFDRVALSIPGNQGVWNYDVTDMNGRILLQTKSNGASELFISLKSLAPGTYLVRASDSHHTYHRKLVVQPDLR